MKLFSEAASYKPTIKVKKYSGPCAFFTGFDSDDFFRKIIFHDGCCHPDGVYGWSLVIDEPRVQVPPLDSPHVAIFATEEATSRVAEALISLYRLNPNRPMGPSYLGSTINWCNVKKLLRLVARWALILLYQLSPNREKLSSTIKTAWYNMNILLCLVARWSKNKLLSPVGWWSKWRRTAHADSRGMISGTQPSHVSRDASSLAVPQEDSMCGDGPSVHLAGAPETGVARATMQMNESPQNETQLIHWYDPQHKSWLTQNTESEWTGWSTRGSQLLTESPWTPWESTLDQSDAPY